MMIIMINNYWISNSLLEYVLIVTLRPFVLESCYREVREEVEGGREEVEGGREGGREEGGRKGERERGGGRERGEMCIC